MSGRFGEVVSGTAGGVVPPSPRATVVPKIANRCDDRDRHDAFVVHLKLPSAGRAGGCRRPTGRRIRFRHAEGAAHSQCAAHRAEVPHPSATACAVVLIAHLQPRDLRHRPARTHQPEHSTTKLRPVPPRLTTSLSSPQDSPSLANRRHETGRGPEPGAVEYLTLLHLHIPRHVRCSDDGGL